MKTYLTHRFTLPIIFIIATGLRFFGINMRPIWYDEALSLLYAQTDPSEIIFAMLGTGGVAANVHPPTYFISLWAWNNFFGDSVVAARLYSVFFGLLTIWVVYLLLLELFADLALANLGTFFVTVSPFHIHFSQEIRMYGVMTFFLLAATYFFVKGIRGGGNRWWVLFAFFAAVAQYLQSLSSFYLAALAFSALFTMNFATIVKTVCAGTGAVLIYLPWLAHMPAQLAKVQLAYWVKPPGWEKLFNIFLAYLPSLPIPFQAVPIALFITILITFLAFSQSWRAFHARNKSVMPGLWLLYMGLVPPLLMLLVSQWLAVFLERALLASGVMFLLWLAWVIQKTSLPMPIARGLLFLLLVVFGLGTGYYFVYDGFLYAPYDQVAESLQNNLDDGHILIHSSKLSMVPTHYFAPELPQIFVADPSGSRIDTLDADTQRVLGLESTQDLRAEISGATVVYLLIFEHSINEAKLAGLNTHPHITILQDEFVQVDSQAFSELLLLEFERKSGGE